MLSKWLYLGGETLVYALQWDYSQPFVLTVPFLLANMLTLHQSRAFSLHMLKTLHSNLPKCLFGLNPGFNNDGIILIMYFLCPSITNALKCLHNQEYLCHTLHTFAKVLSHDIPALADKPQQQWKPSFLQSSMLKIFQSLIFIPLFILKVKVSKFQTFICKDSADFLH